MSHKNRQRFLSITTAFFLVLQSFLPYVPFYQVLASSEDQLESKVEFDKQTNKFKISVNTQEKVEYLLAYRTDKNTEAIQGKAEASDKDFERTIYAGTCSSDDVCIAHDVQRGILKVKVASKDWLESRWFSLEKGSLKEVKVETPKSLDLTDEENLWLKEGTDLSPPTPTPTVSPTPTGEILDGLFTSITPTTTSKKGHLDADIIESYACYADSLNGCVTTDKKDYSPTEVVLISGYGFSPNTEYKLVISGTGNFKVEYTITTDENGAFHYSYQLDGTYRPNYKIEVLDRSGTVVTSTTFTDTPTKVTAKGHEGQKSDGTYSGGNVTEYQEGDNINFRFTLEATHGPTSNGRLEVRYTGDDGTCLFFDNDFTLGTIEAISGSQPTVSIFSGPTATNFGTSNGEWVVTLDIDYPGTFGHSDADSEARVNYTLKLSDEAGECSGSSQHSRLNPTASPVEQSGAQNVPVPANQVIELPEITVNKQIDRDGDGTFEDTADAGEYCFALDGGTCVSTDSLGQVIFTNVTPDGDHTITETQLDTSQGTYTFDSGTGTNCTFSGSTATANVASGQTSTDASCTFKNKVGPGTLTVNKVVVPSSDPGLFNLKIDGTTQAANVGDGGTTGAIAVSFGSHTVSETAGTDTDLADYNVTIGGDCDSGGNVTVSGGQSKTCTITNTRKTGTLQVLKNVDLNGDGDYDDANETGATDWLWQANGGSDHNTGDPAITVPTGDYTLTETAKTDFHFVDLSCTGGDLDDNTVTVSEGANVVCTFTNARDTGTVVVHKDVQGPNGEDILDTSNNFTVELDGANAQSLTDGGTVTYNNVPTGNHTITESIIPSGYTLYGIGTTAGASGNTSGLTTAVVTGQTTDVYVTNRQENVTITIHKDVLDPDGNPVSDSHSFTVKRDGSDAKTIAEGTDAIYSVAPGTYTFTEDSDSDYDLDSITGDDDVDETNGAAVTVAPGGSAELTFINKQKKATINVYKNVVDPDGNDVSDNHEFTAQLNGADDKTFSENSPTSYEVNPGTHSVSELGDPDYDELGCKLDSGAEATNFEVASNDQITVTCTNKQQQAHITVIKKVIGPDGNDVSDTSTNFTLYVDDASDSLTDDEEHTFDVNPETHEVTEDPDENYSFLGCRIADSEDELEEVLAITVASNESVTVECINQQIQAEITVLKNVFDPNGVDISDDHEFIARLDSDEFTDQTIQEDNPASYNVNPGSHTLSELDDEEEYERLGCVLDDQSEATNFSVSSNEQVTVTCNNKQKKAHITVIKQVVGPNDEDVFDDSTDFNFNVGTESAQLTDDEQQTFDVNPGTHSVTEDINENYSFLGCEAVYDEDEIGEQQENGVDVTLESDDSVTVTCTNRQIQGEIIVEKDVLGKDGNDVSDNHLFTAQLNEGNNQQFSEESSTSYFVDPGTHSITELGEDQYEELGCEIDEETSATEFDVASNEVVTVTCTNKQIPGSVTVIKYADNNGNGTRDEGESTLSGWDMTLGEDTKTTDENGEALFDDLNPGSYDLSETLQEGWILTNMFCDNENQEEPDTSNEHPVSVSLAEDVTCEVGNQPPNPILSLTKSNDTGGAAKLPGQSVLFTLVVTATQSAVLSAQVTDLPAGGFTYRPGSWTSSSDVRGDLKAGGTTTEPTYASPGVWNLGDMSDGETVTLTYIADISNSQEHGLYKDLAWTQGESIASTTVIGNESTGVFVGTDVLVEAGTTSSINVKKEQAGEVLGAATLPATGGNTLWVYIASIIFGLGTLLLLIGLTLKRSSWDKRAVKQILRSILMLVFAMLVFARGVNAADDVSIRLSEPKTPTTSNTFNINFVALDKTGSAITVTCFKKGPSDGSFSSFATVNLPAGGSSGNCSVNSSILNAEGSYQFFARAAGSETQDSLIVTVSFNTSGPGTPTNYGKSQVDPCTYKITFKTADDGGKTVKVVLYRSQNTSFGIDDSNKVAELAIGSNTEGSFTNGVAECNKTHYYALRAFDSAGNGSGVVGDSVITTTTTTTQAQPAQASGAIAVGGTAQVLGTQEAQQGEVKGEATPSGKEKPKEDVVGPAGAVQGLVNKVGKQLRNPLFDALLIVVLLIIVYVVVRFQKSRKTL